MTESKYSKRVIAKVWSFPPWHAAEQALRESLTECAIQICHETGDEASFVEFCAETIKEFLLQNCPLHVPME